MLVKDHQCPQKSLKLLFFSHEPALTCVKGGIRLCPEGGNVQN